MKIKQNIAAYKFGYKVGKGIERMRWRRKYCTPADIEVIKLEDKHVGVKRSALNVAYGILAWSLDNEKEGYSKTQRAIAIEAFYEIKKALEIK